MCAQRVATVRWKGTKKLRCGAAYAPSGHHYMVISASPSLPPSRRFFFLPFSFSLLLAFLCLPHETLFAVSLFPSVLIHLTARSLQPPTAASSSSSFAWWSIRVMAFLLFHRFSLRVFPLTSSLRSFPLFSLTLSLSSFPTCSRISLPLFPHLVCFPLPVGNCTLSLLPARCFPLAYAGALLFVSMFFVHLLFFSSMASPSRPVLLYLLMGSLSLLYRPIFHDSGPPPLICVRQQEDNPGRQRRVRLGPASNLIIRCLIIRGRDKNYVGTIIFSQELSFPLYRRLNTAVVCASPALPFSCDFNATIIPLHFSFPTAL